MKHLMFNPMAPPSGSFSMLPEAAEITTTQTVFSSIHVLIQSLTYCCGQERLLLSVCEHHL